MTFHSPDTIYYLPRPDAIVMVGNVVLRPYLSLLGPDRNSELLELSECIHFVIGAINAEIYRADAA